MMKKNVALVCIAAAISLAACGGQSGTQDLSGEALLKIKCKRCHSYKRPLEMRMTRQQWESTVQRMWERIPDAMTAEEVRKIIDYLARERGLAE